MRAPVSWLAEYVDLPAGLDARALGDALVRVGLEVERVESAADGLSGPIVVGRVLTIEELAEFKKPIRFCTVDVGESEPRGVVCGARNFAVGDLVVVSLPGAVLPGGFAIAARPTYGRISDGMICSARELGLGDDHTGILVIPADSAHSGDSAVSALGLDDAVLDIAITPDRGYCMSVRGLAREAAVALDVAFRDIADQFVGPQALLAAYPVSIDDVAGCPQFSARAVRSLDPSAPSPAFIQRRLAQAGMRSISLAVDVTNYVMLETGQPLHAFDRAKLAGPLGVRRASGGEKLTTLDGSVRVLDADDLVVTDESGPIALAGVMGGGSTEIGSETTDIVLEAACWDAASIARTVRRHKLPSEAAKRFERGVDPQISAAALSRAVDLLITHGGAQDAGGFTVAGPGVDARTITLAVDLPSRIAGLDYSVDVVTQRLQSVGAIVSASRGVASSGPGNPGTDAVQRDILIVTPPSWRPDLTDPVDLCEEIIRLVGYDQLPSTLPTPPPGRGLSPVQRMRRSVTRALASAGYIEVLVYPFVAPEMHDLLGLGADDERRNAVRLANPISEAEPELRTSLLPGLLTTLGRNIGRGQRDVAIFESGLVFHSVNAAKRPPRLGVEGRPTDTELALLAQAIPSQPRHVAVVATGNLDRPGWWGVGRAVSWSDAIEAARVVARGAGASITTSAADRAPWHPGRCAALVCDGVTIGYAGELHPAVLERLGLPPRTCAMELDLDKFTPAEPVVAPKISPFPPVLLDLALVVDESVPAQAVIDAVREGAGELLETVRLFDVYIDSARLGPGRKSLALALRLRAPDRTLTGEEATTVRDGAVARATELTGATLRG
jgi:phenylalanyl-tRNA synthetase beta chain